MAVYKVNGKGQNGKYSDDYALRDVIGYIVRDYKTPHCYIGAYGVRPEYAAMQMEYVARAYNNYTGIRLRHSELSFSHEDHVTLETAYQIADAAARFYADRYQIVFSIHEDTDHIHAHFVMNQVSYVDGRKYSGNRKEYFEFINYMKNVCRQYGIKFQSVSDDNN